MSVTVQTIYNTICYDLLEDGGLVLGLVTFEQFINLLNLTILDMQTETEIIQAVYTQQITIGVAQYNVPDSLLRVDSAFCAGRLLSPSTVPELTAAIRGWRRANTGVPQRWHEDELPIRLVELVPAPNYTGTAITGSSASTFWVAGASPAQHRNLTFVGPAQPSTVSQLSDAIPLLPDDPVLGYIGFGILERIFSGENELRDPQRALFCGASYREGIEALKAAMNEIEVQE